MKGVGIQAFILAAITFVVGLVVGGIGPRAELREVREELFELQRARVTQTSPSVRQELIDLVQHGLDDVASRRQDEPSTPPDPALPPVTDPPEPADVDDVRVVGEAPDDDDPPRDPMKVARETLALRYAQARAAFEEDARPSPEQSEAVDVVLAEMNDELIALAYDVVDEVAVNGEPGRRMSMRFAADALDIAVQAESRMLGVLDEDQRARVREEATDPMAFIDPALLDAFAEIEGLQNP